MTFHQRRLQIRRDNRVSLWLDVFSTGMSILFLVAAIDGAIWRFT